MRELPVPDFHRPERWERSGACRTSSAPATLGSGPRSRGFGRPAEDELRICLLAVDVQNTFCIPGFELFVGGRSGTGAVDDNRRLCEFVYRNLGVITQIVPSLDTHRAAADLPRGLARRRRREPSGAVHARLGRGRRVGPLARQPGRVHESRDRSRLRGAAARPLHARTRRGREVRADDLALPRAAGRDRARARLGGRGGVLLPRRGSRDAAVLPGQGRGDVDRALLDPRPGGDSSAPTARSSGGATSS